MTIDKNQLSQAREWAEAAKFYRGLTDNARAAAEVIRDLPDEIVDGDKLRDLAARWRGMAPNFRDGVGMAYETAAADIEALLPAPTPRVEIALGAWAMHPEHGKVLITSTRSDSDGWVKVCMEDDAYQVGAGGRYVKGADLSPVPDTQEPRKLTSFREYKSAGVGAVVREDSETATKEGPDYWRDTDGIEYTDGDMAGVTRTILWEREA